MGCTSSSPPTAEIGGLTGGTPESNRKAILDVLSHIPLLAKFSADEHSKLADVLETKNYKTNEVVFKQDDPGQGFFIIVKGAATVSRHNDQDAKREEVGIAELKSGDYFGEAALLNDSKRMATVTAIQPLQCLYLDRTAFQKMFSQERVAVQFAKRAAVSAEGEHTRHQLSLTPINAVKDKDAATLQLLLDAVQDNVLFRGLSREYKQLIIKEMWKQPIKAGVSVIEQGQKGDNFYVVESGLFDVFVKSGDKTRKVATRARGTCFGELALMYNSPRAASVVAVEDSVVWAVDRFTFRKILANVSNTQLQAYEDFLKKVELLAPLSSRERAKIAEAIEEVVVQHGQSFVQQGSKGDCMFILKEGEVVCTKDGSEVARYKAGDYFGERALFKDEVRAATLSCASPTAVLLRLDQSAVALLLGPLEDIIQKRIDKYDGHVKRGSETEFEESKIVPSVSLPAEPAELPPPKKEDLKVIGLLGKGSFGRVSLVKDPRNNKTYALKAVSKQMIVETGQQGHIMSEKRVMQTLRHPFCIRLYATYKDRDRLYLLLEPSLGGELFTILRSRVNFDENTARFYAASVVSVFEYMHSKNTVYRDLKPENLLLGADGYLKVTDFGFAKVVPDRTYTLCGTPDYLAPEIVEGKGHGKGVDWWTLGILIYEMLASYPPFYDDDPMRTYAKIVQGHVSYPSHFSKAAVNLIAGLLQHKPTHRLGVTQGGAERIKSHPWFKGFDWQALYEKRLPAPIIPKVKNPEDISNFDPDREDQDNVPRYVDNGTNWEADF